ncbi:MAG: formylglycine-generating enzyme family protein, partial [Tannerella sp.]|jgi:formylglycine-generating enzyme required for sulfatase activity|nr:formylglycine-generating enzyme family protein [Tannerella sp.]
VTQEAYDGAGELTTFSVPTNTGTYQFDVAFIPKGKFWTGATPNGTVTNEGGSSLPSTEVTLTQNYYLGTTEVTNAQYAAFLNDMGVDSTGRMPGDSILIYDSKIQIYAGQLYPWGLSWVDAQWQSCSGYDNYPVIWVNWYGAAAYCNWLNSKISGYHFSLPTEAQWEYAALCGTPYAYNGVSDTWNDDFGWIKENSDGHTHEVGTSTSNIWNLYDMHGNDWEWCNDWYGKDTYPAPTAIDPTGANSGGTYALRGGCFADLNSGKNITSVGARVGRLVTAVYYGFRVCAVKDNHVATPLGGTIRKVSVNTTSGALNFQLAFIPKGKFLSGTTTGTEITLTKDYYMGTTQVTNAQYAAFLNDAGIGQDGKMPNDSIGVEDSKVAWSGKYPWGLTWNATANKWEPCSGYEKSPVVAVNLYGTMAYCDWLNAKRLGCTFKLPTEAQWQYAVQGGTQYAYNGLSDIWSDDFGWIVTNSKGHPHEVGTAKQGKNPWNLQDMCGNVWEWCGDYYSTSYPAPTATDPTGGIPVKGDINHYVCRGGAYPNPEGSSFCKASFRAQSAPPFNSNFGFRVCAMTN